MDRGNRERTSLYSVLYKILVYGVFGFAVAVAQTTLFADFGIFSTVPDVTLAFVVAISLFEGEKTGAVAGVALGFAVDAVGAVGLSLSPLLYMLAGAFCGVFSTRILSKNYPSFLFYMLFAAAAHAVTSLIETAFSLPNFTLPDILGGLIVPEFFCTLLYCSCMYPVAKLCTFIIKALTKTRKE